MMLLNLLRRFGTKRVRLIIAGLSTTTFLLAFVPQFTGCCAILGFATNILWLYGVE